MTYDLRERSQQDGAPVELYTFMVGGRVFRFTSAEVSVSVLGFDYTSAPISRNDIERTPERARNNLELSVPRNFPVADLFRIAPPTDVIAVTVRRYHRGDGALAVIWMGRVLNCEFKGAAAELRCEPGSTSLQRTGLRRKYSRQCPHVLYGSACRVVRAAHSTVTTVSAQMGSVLSVGSLASKPYAGGYVEWVTPDGLTERRFITEFAGLDLTLSQPFNGISIGDVVTVSPGCDHTIATCRDVYANLVNYGGFPFTPQVNPFGGARVY